MKRTLTLICLSALTQTLNAQTHPTLLQAADKPAFTYMECYPGLPAKKDRHCSKFEFILQIKSDTLYITEVHTSLADVPKKSTSYNVNYKVAIDNIFVMETIEALTTKNNVARLKNLEGEKQHFFQFKLLTGFVPYIIREKGKHYTEEQKYNELYMYSESMTDAKQFLNYIKSLRE